MTIKKIKLLVLAALTMIGCEPDYGMNYEVVEEIQPTQVVIDSLIQPSPPETLDILIILDTSGSMSDNFQQVSAGVELLREDIEKITLDYRIGFINSGLSRTPYFVGPFDSTALLIDFLMAPYTLGDDWLEQGFQALYEFTTTTQEGAMFFRPEADKLFIFVSDEDEQGAIPTNIFHDWLTDHFKDVQHDVVSIVQVEDGLCTSWGTYDIGYRYMDLAAYYGKNAIDICSDWELWLSDSTFLVGAQQHIALTQLPLVESIIVYRNGVETDLWNYTSSNNTVYLDFAPDPGELIEVGYVVL
jgi:hypothetical protein